MSTIRLNLKDNLSEPFQNYKELFEYIQNIENMKLFEDHPEFARTAWSFIILSPERLKQHRQALEKVYDIRILPQALARQLSIIEICEGDYTRPRQILLTPGLDTGKLKKDWCKAYCKAHGIDITQTC